MKVLVTGGGGFVGRKVVDRLLARGYAVRSFGRKPQVELEALGVEVRCGDLTDAAAVATACEEIDVVFHVAARAGVWGSWDDFYRPNVMGTEHVIAGCRKHGIQRLVYTSTPSVVFNGRPIVNGDESMPYGSDWLCHYAHTKAIAEKKALEANSEALSVVALRPHLIFGPGDPHLLPRVIESAVAGRLKIVGSGENRVDVSYVEDVAEAHLNALDALDAGKAAGKAYFISQGEPVSLWPWTNVLLERLGHVPIETKLPLRFVYGVGAICELVWKLLSKAGEPPMTRFVAVELGKDHFFTIEAAKRDLGYTPSVTMDQAVKATVADLRERGFGA